MKQHREIPADYKIKSCTISKTKTGKYYISILTEYEKDIRPVNIQKVVGLDFAMDGLYVESEQGKCVWQNKSAELCKGKMQSPALNFCA
jgi:putative transposase